MMRLMDLFRKPIIEPFCVGNACEVENPMVCPLRNDEMTPEENAEFKKVFSDMADVLSARAAAPAPTPHTYTPTMNTAEAEAEARRRLDASLRGERLPPPVGAVRDAEQKIVVDMAAKMKAINDFDADMSAQGYRFVE